MEALQKRHDEFLTKLNAQDEKMKNLNEQLNKISSSSSKYFSIAELELILKNLVAKRLELKQIAVERKRKLKKSKEFFEFKNQCDELNAWISERRRDSLKNQVNAAEKSANTLYLLEKQLNKHEALEKELNANRTRLYKLKQISANVANQSEIAGEAALLLSAVEANWLDLEKEAKLKGKKLVETKCKADLNASLVDVDTRMKNLEHSLNTKYNANDLRSVKEALKKHKDLRKQLTVEVDLVGDLAKMDTKLNQSGRATPLNESQENTQQNKLAIENAVREYMQKFKLLNPLIEKKQRQLETDLAVQQLIFDISEELKWVSQNRNQIEFMSSQLPASLFDAQNLCKKQAELERAIINKHKPIIEKLNEQVDKLVNNPADVDVEELKTKAKMLNAEWSALLKLNEIKKVLLNECLSEQQDLDKLGQISLGISEKFGLIQTINSEALSGKDEIVLNKHLLRLEQLEHDLKGYEVRSI